MCNEEPCCICLSEIDEYCTSSCNHLFHEECFKESIKRNNLCPLCRQKITYYTYFNKTIPINKEMIKADICYIDMNEEKYDLDDINDIDDIEQKDSLCFRGVIYSCLGIAMVCVSPFMVIYMFGRCIRKTFKR